MRVRERGAGLLIPVLLIVTVAAFAVVVAASQSGGDIQASDAHADSVEALFLAETGVERALKRFATGVANCGVVAPTLAEAITDLRQLGLGNNTGGRTITIATGLDTDFSSVTFLSSQTQCRVRVTATIAGSNVSRTIHAIVDRNLLAGQNNHDYNEPALAGAPLAGTWTLLPAGSWALNGGPDAAGPCSRSGWLLKAGTGPAVITRGQGDTTFPAGITVTGGTTTTVYFRYRLNDRGPPDVGCVAGASGGPAWPGACDALPAPPGGTEASVCFRTIDTGPTTSTGVRFDTASTVTLARVCPDPGTATTTFATCATGYPVLASRNITMGGAGARTLATFRYHLRLVAASRREIFIDNIQAVNTSSLNAARVQVWRDCSSAADPATCL